VIEKCSTNLLKYKQELSKVENDLANKKLSSTAKAESVAKLRGEQMDDLRKQVSDL